MSDSVAGFSVHSEEQQLTFCGEYCQSFVDRSCAFVPSFSVTKPLKEIVFAVAEEELVVEVKSTRLLSFSVSFCDQGDSPLHATLDVYKVEEGTDKLPSGRFIALFKLRPSQKFAEFFLTDKLQLEKPLPHVKMQVDTEQTQLLSEILCECIHRSNVDILSITLQVPIPSAQENLEDEELLAGLNLS